MNATEQLQARISHNVGHVRGRIRASAQKAGRDPEEITLVAVTKTVGLDEMRILHELGVTHLAENRVEAAREKIPALNLPVHWHMIGTIQRRKVAEAVQLFDHIDAIDRMSVAKELQKRCEQQEKNVPVLVQVNVSGEESKHGFTPHKLESALGELKQYDRLTVDGLLTMAPYGADESFLRNCFRTLRELGDGNGLKDLSMGMSNDYEIAVEEGATQVRIGSALFE